MSNAKYRAPAAMVTHAMAIPLGAAARDPEHPSTETLLACVKDCLGAVLQDAAKKIREGRLDVHDALTAAKQVIAIARLEQRKLERAERAVARTEAAAKLEPQTEAAPDAPAQAEKPSVDAAEAFGNATADNPTDPKITLGQPEKMRQAG